MVARKGKGKAKPKSKAKKNMGRYSSIPGAGRFAKSTLDKVYKRGLGAYYSSGSRRVSAHSWAMGRVRSYVTGKGGARKADADLYRGRKKK